jgi:hypothetical protein
MVCYGQKLVRTMRKINQLINNNNNNNFVAQIPSYEASSSSGSRENLCILWKSNVCCRVQNSRDIVPTGGRSLQSEHFLSTGTQRIN